MSASLGRTWGNVFLVTIFYIKSLTVDARDSCYSNMDCNFDDACCRNASSRQLACQQRLFALTSSRNCYGYYCTSDSDCRGPSHGKKICCETNKCVLCNGGCVQHAECAKWQSCCIRAHFQQSRCRYSCVGEYCLENSHCGLDECCRYNRCVYCSDPGCRDDEGCPTGQHCCDTDYFSGSKCRSMCVGENCTSDKDCSLSAHCHVNKCVKRDTCEISANCSDRMFCCKANDNVAYCRQTCEGSPCLKDSDCGSNIDCCLNYKCSKCGNYCTSSSDCFNGALCCKSTSPSIVENKCGFECMVEACNKNSDCVGANKWCIKGECAHVDATKPCNHISDCVTDDKKQSFCCPVVNSATKSCSLSCAERQCNSDDDCIASNQCCNSLGFCTAFGCQSKIPKWLYGVFALILLLVVSGLLWCHRQKLKCSNMSQCNESALQATIYSCGMNDRGQNGNVGLPNDVRLPPMQGSQGLTSCLSPSTSSNQLAECQSCGNDVNEPITMSTITTNTFNLNIPPPPYTFEEGIMTPERVDEPPPGYQVLSNIT